MEHEKIEQLILENQNLIYSITKYFERYSNKEDLFQAGCIGMIMAYKNFDDTMNVKFTTYAYSYILGEMRKCIRDDKSLKVGRSIQGLHLRIEKTYALLTQKYMREPSHDEIAEFLELPVFLVTEAINSMIPTMSIDEPVISGEREMNLHDLIGNVETVGVDELLSLKTALSNLNEEEKELIEKRYMKDLTQQQVAQSLNTNQVQVSRYEKKILIKLRNNMVA